MPIKIDRFTDLVLKALEKRKRASRLRILYEHLYLLDSGIFNKSSIFASNFRTEIIGMLENGDIDHEKLSTFFTDYKDSWLDSKTRYFETLEEIEYKDFLKEFKNDLPQDIQDSIKKCKSTDINDLEIDTSIHIFKFYYQCREWLKAKISEELESLHLSDNELFLLAKTESIKFEWLGNAVDLVGLLQVLEDKKWIVPPGSYRNKSTYLLKCFQFAEKNIKIESVTNIYKKGSMNYKPFDKISVRK